VWEAQDPYPPVPPMSERLTISREAPHGSGCWMVQRGLLESATADVHFVEYLQ